MSVKIGRLVLSDPFRQIKSWVILTKIAWPIRRPLEKVKYH